MLTRASVSRIGIPRHPEPRPLGIAQSLANGGLDGLPLGGNIRGGHNRVNLQATLRGHVPASADDAADDLGQAVEGRADDHVHSVATDEFGHVYVAGRLEITHAQRLLDRAFHGEAV